jgi:hypothetical protein
MKSDDTDAFVDRLIEGLEPPRAPTGLRTRVLAAARGHMETTSPDRWSRIWSHRGIRLAWAATVVLLLAGHAIVAPPKGAVFTRVNPTLVAETGVDEQLADILRPVRISANVQPIVGLISTADDSLTELEMGGNPS